VGVLALIVLVALFSTGTQDPSSEGVGSDDPSAETSSSDAPELRCIERWNASPDDRNPGRIWSNDLDQVPYAAVGFSADFPDRCLVTLGLPDQYAAVQFEESSDGSWRWVGGGMPQELPESAKQWNARRERDGTLVPGAL
jgi:hypothetical protein